MLYKMLKSCYVIISIILLYIRILICIVTEIINLGVINTVIYCDRINYCLNAYGCSSFFISMVHIMDIVLLQIISEVLSEVRIQILI